MSRKSRIDPAEKVKAVEDVLAGRISEGRKARELGVVRSALQRWIVIYKSSGPAGLLHQDHNKVYSKEIKFAAVNDYLSGRGSLSDIAIKYGLRSDCQLRHWIKDYNAQGTITSRGSGGGSYLKKARQTTLEERQEIVQYCLDHDCNYGETAKKYECSYQQVRNWVLKYKEMDDAGLQDRRGRRAGTQPSRTKEEELRDELARVKRENADLKMENELLKKLRELKMKDRNL